MPLTMRCPMRAFMDTEESDAMSLLDACANDCCDGDKEEKEEEEEEEDVGIPAPGATAPAME